MRYLHWPRGHRASSIRFCASALGCHGSVVDSWEVVVRDALVSLGIFVLVLVVLKFFFGWNISIIGSVVLTIILSLIFRVLNRR